MTMKYTLLLLLLSAAWFLLSLADQTRAEKNVPGPRIPSYSLSEMQDIFARQQDLERERQRIHLYHNNQRETLSRLGEKQITLHRAATVLVGQAREEHPRLLEGLEVRYPLLSNLERMALRLLEQLEESGCQSQVIECLCREMTTWSEADPTRFRLSQTLQPR